MKDLHNVHIVKDNILKQARNQPNENAKENIEFIYKKQENDYDKLIMNL